MRRVGWLNSNGFYIVKHFPNLWPTNLIFRIHTEQMHFYCMARKWNEINAIFRYTINQNEHIFVAVFGGSCNENF